MLQTIATSPAQHLRDSKLRPVPVILDGGDAAAVFLLYLPAPPQPGFTFLAHGQRWVVVRPADHLRGAVAHPVRVR